MKKLKVMFDTTSSANSSFKYKIGEVNVANNWNPNASHPKEIGGFNFSNEENILRWLIRGNTLYDVEIPSDAEVINLNSTSTPNGVFITNKIILTNPRLVTDEIAMELYQKSNMPEKTYYKALAGLAINGYINTAKQLIKDRINYDNIDLVLSEIQDFTNHKSDEKRIFTNSHEEEFNEVMQILNEIKNPLLINQCLDREPYEKYLTQDKIINLTGESGSGKSYYSKKYLNDDNYLVIDTDLIFSNQETNNNLYLELKELFKDKDKSILIDDFDYFYQNILNHFKDTNKIIVIDSAQYRNLKNINILKGKIIIMRTCINTCYERCISRWKSRNNNYTEEELIKFSNKKKGMYSWYHSLNDFIIKINSK